jgi:hypothetical protein
VYVRGTRGTPGADWRPAFLLALREAGAVRYACEAAGVGRTTAYRHRERDATFASAWAEAIEDACDELEAEARRRAKEGSDQLLMFLLKSHRPRVYRDAHRIEHAGAIEHRSLDYSRLGDDELRTLVEITRRADPAD